MERSQYFPILGEGGGVYSRLKMFAIAMHKGVLGKNVHFSSKLMIAYMSSLIPPSVGVCVGRSIC